MSLIKYVCCDIENTKVYASNSTFRYKYLKYYFYLITGFNDALFHVRLTNFIVKHRFFQE